MLLLGGPESDLNRGQVVGGDNGLSQRDVIKERGDVRGTTGLTLSSPSALRWDSMSSRTARPLLGTLCIRDG